eukprot:CAMPEP_0169366902 /NCGR_PEP_ID=MMETSP1017-20121227/33377_1 /TAXON_ID=342587 /ORGANISM="Karlodinium micrum, Strain CCMP2283" /LENGTH=366 /DNA_ID=CAMNT_0009464895 /DNA_START=35 /DNA_END=1136 /DNA_ORIENTATION=-
MTKRTHSEICTEIAAVDANLAPSAYRDELRATAKELVAAGKGLLACDEPPHVLPTRMKMCWSKPEECNEEWRIGYRELLFTTPGLSQYVSGVILHEETVHQSMSASKGAEKQTVPHMLKSLGIVPGVRRPWRSLQKILFLGLSVRQMASPLHIGPGMPSETAIRIECDGLARYAAICQENGLMPIVEPDVVMDGAHSIEVSAKITKHVLIQTFASLDRHNVDVEGILIKTNMVRPGEKSTNPECPELVGAATVKVFGSCLPVNLPGIVFLSGGMSEEFATSALAAINAHEDRKKLPWPLTFSYGRALQHSARVNWQGNPDNFQKAQTALLERARVNSEASLGRYAESAATNGSTTTSLHVEGGNKY